ncbi:MAG: BREX-6 system adenine-specific DNA-methyltransferase PglX [Deltaproteobacteria bacterium]
MSLTSEAKRLLAETIRGTQQDPEKGLRARLLRAIHDEADRRYRLSLPIGEAGLDEIHRRRRERIEAWIDERSRAAKPKNKMESATTKKRLLFDAEKEAAATFLNRLVVLRLLEAHGLSKPLVLTGGWNSKGYREFREFAPPLTADDTEGYDTLLQLLFDELASDLPGLFGEVGLTRLFPIPAAMLKETIERLDDAELASAWLDDTTLGWTYQFWNDFERDALDAKVLSGGKIEPHEIAAKTQMFTDRYIAEWLLQNSLGLTWLAMCRKRGWTPDADRVLAALEVRRADWRDKRDSGEVALTALMPVEDELEERWKFYVPQQLPDGATEMAPDSVGSLKILDPACGSGHFLVIAFDHLAALYREEARHRKMMVTDREIAESILENNLHGVDIDPRATQIAAASLYLKAKSFSKTVRPKRVNLVAPVLQLGNLPMDDPAVVALRKELKSDVGIPEELTSKLLSALAGVDYLGSLLKVDAAIESSIRDVELEFERTYGQGSLFDGFPTQQGKLSVEEAKATILDRLERFLAKRSTSEDLGLRLDGQQLAAGVRFVRMVREGTYDIVLGNPPYQGISKTEAFGYVTKTYPRGKADLCSAFLEHGLELARPGGISAMVAMRSWMFLAQFSELRRHLLHTYDLRTLGDLDKGAFESMPTSQLISVAMTVFRRTAPSGLASVALQPTAPGEKYWGPDRTDLKRAAILVQRGAFGFGARGFSVIPGEPLVYWWSDDELRAYGSSKKIADVAAVRFGVRTSDNRRFVRRPWEVRRESLSLVRFDAALPNAEKLHYVPIVMGGAGVAWGEPVTFVIDWKLNGFQVCVTLERAYGAYPQSTEFYFRRAVALPKIGDKFKGRLVRYRSVVDNAAPSVFIEDTATILCSVNRTDVGRVLASLNPSLNTQPGDILRLPVYPDPFAYVVEERVLRSLADHESGEETSVEFKAPRASTWASCQKWAQDAVDRKRGSDLRPYEPVAVAPRQERYVSFAVGSALGRFAATEGGAVTGSDSKRGLQGGILFVSVESGDSLQAEGTSGLRLAWDEHGATVGQGDDLSAYLRKSFFGFHKKLYENRPIYFPLSSSKRSFVALVSIHGWADDTLKLLLADHVVPAKRRLDGELDDLRTARASGNNKAKAEKRFTEVQKLFEELNDFISKITEIAEKGPPPLDDKTQGRHADAKFVMDLDDGVVVNAAALWPLLEPQWKDPKKWWQELANAQRKKDYDWSHLAARYFPTRVRAKCHEDPSLAVAHKCFWELHPAKAYAWELRLQDEIRSDFTIDEPNSDAARAAFLAAHAREASDTRANELKRRARKVAKLDDSDAAGPILDCEDGPEETADA